MGFLTRLRGVLGGISLSSRIGLSENEGTFFWGPDDRDPTLFRVLY